MMRHRLHNCSDDLRRRACRRSARCRSRTSAAGSRLVWIRILRVRCETPRPAIAQEPQPRGLALDADAFVKRQRLGDRVVVGRGMRPDLFELADVLAPGLACRRQRPQRLDVLPPDVEESRADRRQQPLVQAGAVEVTAEILHLEREVRERVSAVHDRLDASAPRLVANRLDRKYLSGQVRDVTEVQHLRRRRDGADQSIGELAQLTSAAPGTKSC